jgi:uncharacterized protein (TIGR02466 family)
MQVVHKDVFPTRLWIFDLAELLPQFDDWQERIMAWRHTDPAPAGRSNRRGWNSQKTLFSESAFAPLKEAANTAFSHAFRDMELSSAVRFRLEAWVNLHDPGGFNTLHVHPGVLLCGCLYLQVPDDAGPIVFRDPRPGVVLTPFSGKGIHCGGDLSVRPAASQLIVFPNWLEHRVEPNDGTEPRISIAMNALAA